MTAALIFTVLMMALAGYLFLRNGTPASRTLGTVKGSVAPPINRKRDNDKTFRSVGIDAAVNCCESARLAAGQRYLIKQAPKLPITGCNAEECNCKYIHFADRRGNDYDRRGLGRIKKSMTDLGEEGERRQRRGRRKADL